MVEFTHSASDRVDNEPTIFLPSSQLVIHLTIPSFLTILSAIGCLISRLDTTLLTQQILPCSHTLICLQNAKDKFT